MKATAPADLQRWSEEVARDPASLSFVPLARTYRKQGRRDAALKICLRGLEHHPTLVEGHALLAMLYFESGQRSKAYDEWSMVLRLAPENFEALRGMGFFHLEQGDDVSALRSLQRAGALKPNDLAVQEALKMIRERQSGGPAEPMEDERDPWEAVDTLLMPDAPEQKAAPTQGAPGFVAPHTQAPSRIGPFQPAPKEAPPAYVPAPTPTYVPPQPIITQTPAQTAPAASASATQPPPQQVVHEQPISSGSLPRDPSQLFAALQRGGQILGALLLDSHGLVLAGSLTGEEGSKAELLGASLGGAIEEANRTSAHLALGAWQGILLEAEQALLHLAPVREGIVVLVAARRQTPAGFMLRAASQANALAQRFLELYA